MSLTVNGSQTNSQDLLVGNNLGVGGTITGNGAGLTNLNVTCIVSNLPALTPAAFGATGTNAMAGGRGAPQRGVAHQWQLGNSNNRVYF